MKILKRILAVCSFCTLLTATNCFAVTLDKTDVTDDKLNCYRTYLVQDKEQNSFIENIEKDIEVFGDKYTFDSYEVTGGTTLDTIEINTTKKITSKTKNLDSIINQLGTTISFDKNGYVGEYVLNTDNIQIKTNYNGYREDLIEETINYNGLSRNDLDFLPKQTVKDRITLDLLNIEWKVETTKKIGEYEVADVYTAKCYYAGKQRVDYPNTYSVVAKYTGTASKEIETYRLKYNKVPDSIPEVVEEKKENNIMPVVGGTTGCVLVILFFLTRNVTVYNYKNGEYKKVGKTRMKTNNTINLTRFSLFETTNRYKLEFSKGLTNKIQGKMITIAKGNTKIKMLVNTDDENYRIETRI